MHILEHGPTRYKIAWTSSQVAYALEHRPILPMEPLKDKASLGEME